MSSLPTRLRVEHLRDGEPCGVPAPRFSWWLPESSTTQLAWELEVTGPELTWTSGRREGGQSVLVSIGPTLPSPVSGERRRVRVRVWTAAGVSEWSEPASWVSGLLAPADVSAQWIEPAEPVLPPPGERPGYALRREFQLVDPVTDATVFATAHGLYELRLNGSRVGDDELTPGFTSYRSRLQVQSWNVGELLVPGRNTIEVLLTDGWFRGRHGFEREPDGFGNRTAALVELVARHPDGTTTAVGTDSAWESKTTAIRAADLMDGERIDVGAEGADWLPVNVGSGGLYANRERLVTSVAPPVRRIRELAPVSINRLASGSFVVDFGENLSGWIRQGDLGPAGARLVLTHGEALAPDGTVSTENIRAFDFASGTPLPAGQVDEVISAGPGDAFEPRHTTHGFQFVQIDGHPGPLSGADLRAIVVHTDLDEAGSFECSDARINALHAAGVRSFLGNACDLPTDCPQRERSGFTGDWQVYVGTAAFTHDVAGFSDKWLRDLAADQWDNG